MSNMQDTAAWKIFFKRWDCKIRESEVVDPVTASVHGIFITGEVERDKAAAATRVHANRTIAQLAEMHAEGQRPDILSSNDAYDMYNLIMQHLRDCNDLNGGNVWSKKGPPKEDLVILDNFAQYLFNYARIHFLDNHKSAGDRWREALGDDVTSREQKLSANIEHVSAVDDKGLTASQRLTRSRRWK